MVRGKGKAFGVWARKVPETGLRVRMRSPAWLEEEFRLERSRREG